MFDFAALQRTLDSLGLEHWNDELVPLLRERLTGQTHGVLGYLSVLAVMVAVLGIMLGLFFTGGMIERALGRVGINVVTRLLGILLAALSVQFVLDGLRGFGFAG